jgi:hypothetical protein
VRLPRISYDFPTLKELPGSLAGTPSFDENGKRRWGKEEGIEHYHSQVKCQMKNNRSMQAVWSLGLRALGKCMPVR